MRQPRAINPNLAGCVLLGFIAIAPPALAAPINLLCKGSLNFPGHSTQMESETAILDLENRTFKPPLYPAFPVTKVSEAEIGFESEAALSTMGTLDRVSGALSMNVMSYNDRHKLAYGDSVKFLAWMTAKCVPAQRMF